MKVFPDNTQSSFRVLLPHAIEFSGDWEVALSEIQIPTRWDTVNKKYDTLYLHETFTPEVLQTLVVKRMLGETIFQSMGRELNEAYFIVKSMSETEQEEHDFDKMYQVLLSVRDDVRLKVPEEILNVVRWGRDFEGFITGESGNIIGDNRDALKTLSATFEPFTIVVEKKPDHHSRKCKVVLPHGFYYDANTLFQVIEKEVRKVAWEQQFATFSELRLKFELLKNRKVFISVHPSSIKIEFPATSPGLGQILGLSDKQLGSLIGESFVSHYPIDIKRGVYSFYIYSPIIRDQVVGDTFAPLLRCVPIPEDETKNTHVKIYDNPDFYPLSTHRLESIHILICNDSGEQVHFISGKTVLKLKFRKIK